MQTKCFVYHGIEIREIVGKLIIRRVSPEFEQLCSQFGLHIRVLGEFDQCPLNSQILSLDVSHKSFSKTLSYRQAD